MAYVHYFTYKIRGQCLYKMLKIKWNKLKNSDIYREHIGIGFPNFQCFIFHFHFRLKEKRESIGLARRLERAQLIFLIFRTFAVCKVAFLSTNLKPDIAIENYISRSIYGESNLRLQSKQFNPPPNVDRSD